MKQEKQWYLLFIFLVTLLLQRSSFALAQNIGDFDANVRQGTNLLQVIGNLLNPFLLLMGIGAFLATLYGGFLYLTAGGDPARAERGRRSILYAVVGIVVIFLSYVSVRYFNNVTGTGSTGPTATPTLIGPPAPFIGPPAPARSP